MENAKNQHLVPNFASMTLSDLLRALASPDPTPGGGTAAAIAGAMGTSLLVMVAGLAKSKSNTDDEKAALAKARAAIEPITSRLTDLADADAASFDAVMAAYRMAKATDEEKIARTSAIQSALRGATEIPLETLRRAPRRSSTRASSPTTAIDRRKATSASRLACSALRRPEPPPTCGATWAG